MPRGRAGLSAIHQRAAATKKLQSLATTYEANSITHAQNAIKTLQESITTFASSHKEDIATDPAFRAQFLQMCGPLGVDPLSSESGFWGKTLGIGDFYYELAVKASEICVAYKSRNGGVMALSELRAILEARENKKVRSQKKKIKISEGDVETAIQVSDSDGDVDEPPSSETRRRLLTPPRFAPSAETRSARHFLQGGQYQQQENGSLCAPRARRRPHQNPPARRGPLQRPPLRRDIHSPHHLCYWLDPRSSRAGC